MGYVAIKNFRAGLKGKKIKMSKGQAYEGQDAKDLLEAGLLAEVDSKPEKKDPPKKG